MLKDYIFSDVWIIVGDSQQFMLSEECKPVGLQLTSMEQCKAAVGLKWCWIYCILPPIAKAIKPYLEEFYFPFLSAF